MIVLDIGGTKIAVARWVDGHLHDRMQIPMPVSELDWQAAIRSLALKYPEADRLGVAVTGSTDGHVINAINHNIISFWNDYPLAAFMEETWRCPVLLLNDAQAAAWGEYIASDKKHKNLLFITLSTGVGGGLVLDGELRIGHLGLAGHVGHVSSALKPMDGDITCGCGRLNCLETISSGTALARQATQLTGTTKDAISVFSSLCAKDDLASKIVSNSALAIAELIANTHATLGINHVSIGGSVGLASGMVDAILAAQQKLPSLFHVSVQAATLREDAGLIGIGYWARHEAQRREANNRLQNLSENCFTGSTE